MIEKGLLAQLVEQRTLNPLVVGSNPTGPTNIEDPARECRVFLLCAVLYAGLCGGCTSYGPGDVRVGQTADDVVRSMGSPTGRYALSAGGTRLEFARGPYGKHTYMIDLDATGHVMAWHQALDESHFAMVQPGESRDEVLQQLGHPSDTRYIGWQKLVVWAYRYDTLECQWFQVSLDVQGRVHDTSYGVDPHCDAGDHKRHR